MRVANATADMQYKLVDSRIEVSRKPVGIIFVRRCGMKIDFSQRGEKCSCSTCLQSK